MKKSVLLSAIALMPALASANVQNHPDSVYVIEYANPQNTKEGIHIAYSTDKKTWIPVGNNRSLVTSDFGQWGGQKNMFRPSMYVDASGETFAVWGLGKNIHQFATTRTRDFTLWVPQEYPFVDTKSCVEPVLTKENGAFVVRYKTDEGEFYQTESRDFINWSKVKKIDASLYASRYETAVVAQREQQGEIHRLPWNVVSTLINNVQASDLRAQKIAEHMRDDATRFRNLKDVKAGLKIDLADKKNISPDLIGIFFEDISSSADGGIYPELVQNRDFEYGSDYPSRMKMTDAWKLVGEGTEWYIADENPLHPNNRHYSVLATTTPGASLVNGGFDGIAVKKGEKYDLSLFAKALDGSQHSLKVSLKDGETVLASVTLKTTFTWKQQSFQIVPSADASKAELCIEPLATGKVGLDFISLFPKNTFKNRKNGLRTDMAQLLADMKPRFVRFPGGCATHGQGINNIYHWQSSVGPLWERKGDLNLWGYHQSRGLGFFEYFQMCEDLGAEPLPVLAAGVPCQNSVVGGHGQNGGIPFESELGGKPSPYTYNGKPLTMESYLQELLDLIEWANGDPKKSALAKMRADAGHPKPFGLKMLGIGNEDLIGEVFASRFKFLYDGVRKAHPEITVVGTVGPFFEGSDYEFGWKLAKEQNIPIVDEHYYVDPGWYIHNQNYYDRYSRTGTKVYLGEWASRGNNLENALAEALHITNLERNGDVVVMSSYAPLFAKEGRTNWNPDLIYFNNTEVKPTVNYYVQKLAGVNAGDVYVNGRLTVDSNDEAVRLRVGSSVVTDSKTGDIIIKLVNCLPQPVNMDVALGELKGYNLNASVSVITGNYDERNLTPSQSTIAVSDQFQYEMPRYSFSVIRIKKK